MKAFSLESGAALVDKQENEKYYLIQFVSRALIKEKRELGRLKWKYYQ